MKDLKNNPDKLEWKKWSIASDIFFEWAFIWNFIEKIFNKVKTLINKK